MRTLAYICLMLCVALCLANAGTARAQSAARGRIAFTSPAGNSLDLFIYDLDTNARTNVTQGRLTGVAATFAWSPDGTRLVVAADRGSNLYVVGSDGTGLRALTQNTGFAITQTPTWSPDGSQIAFVCDAASNYDICLVNADGSDRRRLTNTASIYRDLAWSPDGKSIAYASGPDFFNTKIFVMNADGTLPRQLSTGEGTNVAPAWSPDGSRIAYENDFQYGPADIFVMNSDGSGQLRLTTDFHSDRHPTWSPDGKSIAFSSDRTGSTSVVYMMNPDGSEQVRATFGTAPETAPAWQPNPSLAQATPTPTPAPVYSVSGHIKDSNGAPVPGVVITFELTQQGAVETRTAQTDAGGNYTSGEVGCRNSVKVTPTKLGLSFTPQAGGFVSTGCLSGAGIADFVAVSDSLPRYSISGRVTDNRGTGIDGATVTLTGTISSTTMTDATGRYSFMGLPAGGSYSLSPSKPGQFVRFALGVPALNADQTVDLRLLPYVNVFARVSDTNGNALAGVAVRPDNAIGGPLTNLNGTVNYSITYPYGGEANIKLIPSKYGYVFDPAEVSFNTAAGNQTLTFTGALASPIYDTQFFVRRHYADFFNREPDASGLAFWTQGIDTCGTDDGCREVKRIDASAAFFLSIEFQRTGFLAYCARRAAYGDLPGKPVPLTFAEFLADTRQLGEGVVVGPDGDWQARLGANQRAYFFNLVSTERFLAKYPEGLNEDAFTYALYTTAGIPVTGEDIEVSRTAFLNMTPTMARAYILQRLAEKETLQQRETNRAFVLMQYFGYLRRNPDDVGFDGQPDPNFTGYNFWLGKLEEFGGDYRRAEMVKGFINSIEYRDRFKQP